jgi:hypothetical protein
MNPEIYNYNHGQLTHYLRYETGSSNPGYFKAVKPGGMKLQQVPEEYASLLLFLKERNVENYLALGIGNGGSFAMECFFMKNSLKWSIAIDCLSYAHLIDQKEEEILSFIDKVEPFLENGYIGFKNTTTDNFFENFKGEYKFDAIFIDADHSYEGARKDYKNSMKNVYKGSVIIFHDINSKACPGIVRLWNEVKKAHVKHWEFIHSDTCGIGVVEC